MACACFAHALRPLPHRYTSDNTSSAFHSSSTLSKCKSKPTSSLTRFITVFSAAISQIIRRSDDLLDASFRRVCRSSGKVSPTNNRRLVFLFHRFSCSVFVELLRLRQGVIATFKQPSRREPNTSYASTIWSSLNLCVSSGSGSKRFDCTIDISRRMRSLPPGQSVVTIL
jgi:hypothetical protein